MAITPNERSDLFFAKVQTTGFCWEWTGCLQPNGYGQFWNGTRVVKSHRWAYEHLVGPIPAGLDLDHLCRNRGCCNPDHLEPVTRSENLRRGLGAERLHHLNDGQTHCKHGHELAGENLVIRDSGRRRCRACARRRSAECAKRKRAA